MKATGIVRRIDGFGRVVIPKEICRTYGIREGDPLEIFTDDGSVIFRRYNYSQPLHETLQRLREDIRNTDDLQNRSALLKMIAEMDTLLSAVSTCSPVQKLEEVSR